MKNTFALFSLMLLAVSSVAIDAGFSLGDILLASSLLIAAAKKGDLSEVKKLIEDGEDVDCKDEEGNTALIHAALFNYIELVKLLLHNRAYVNHVNEEGMTALKLAAMNNGRNEVVKILLNGGADGKDTLMWAAVKNEHKAADVLLMVNVNYKNQHGDTALIVAAKHDNSEVVKVLLDNKADVDYGNENDGNTALMAAASDNYIEVATVLLKNSADIELYNHLGQTAVSLAATQEMVELLEGGWE